jgi:glycosyltransferase involved in cell wall biosynthesis
MKIDPGVVLAHDYVTQCGGAERVALCMADAFPGAPMYTTLYEPSRSFPAFADVDLRTSRLNRVRLLRRHHRLALPFLAGAVDSQRIEAEVLLASSSGWAHGYRGAARTVVYCHAPARWLYQPARYLGRISAASRRERLRATVADGALLGLGPRLRRWDRTAAARADVYLANSTVTQQAISDIYGIEARVLPPPPALLPGGEDRPVSGVEAGYLLCVARLLPYKNVDAVIRAAQELETSLVVVGDGPDRSRLEALVQSHPSRARVHILGRVRDDELRWLYRHCDLLVAASYEDFGLSPLEAGSFGRPAVALRDGGYLDTVIDGETGLFFDEPEPQAIARAIEHARATEWDRARLEDHLRQFNRIRFAQQLQEVVRLQREPQAAVDLHKNGH